MTTLLYLPQFWFARLYVSAHIGVIALVACFGSDTLLQRIVTASGVTGFWCVLALAVLSGLAVLDVLVNDLLPRRYKLCRVKRYRHFLYIAQALGMVSLGFVIARQVGVSTLHASVFLSAVGAAWLAFLDLYARHNEQ